MAPRLSSLRGLERDVYHIIKKFEDNNDGKPFKNISAAYDAIKHSNSSLSRQKKRPLEDAIDRVLRFRKEELADSEDSEAALEDAEPVKPDDDRFLLNRQLTKHWHQPSGTQSPMEQPVAKKRRIQEEGDERDGAISGPENAAPELSNGADLKDAGPRADKLEKSEKSDKTSQKKTSKLGRFQVEQPSEPLPLGGVGEIHCELLSKTLYLFKSPHLYAQNAWRQVPGMLLYGPPGTGKRSLVRTLAADLKVPLVNLTGCLTDPERLEKSLTEAVDAAMGLAPSILFIENIDRYMPNPTGSSNSEHSRRVSYHFERQLRRIQQEQPKDLPVLALATASRITEIDPVILECGLLEQTLQMCIPDAEARHDILKVLTKDMPLSDSLDLAEVAKLTHGFVGADILSMITVAQQGSERRLQERQDPGRVQLKLYTRVLKGTHIDTPEDTNMEWMRPLSEEHPMTEPLSLDDFKVAIRNFTPSLRREGFTVIPNVTWDQVGALQRVREQLQTSIIGPIKNPALYQEFGLMRPAGALLWGPPGCGKTLVAQAVANEAQASFILINGPELLNKYVGESERAVRELFKRARSSTPCILFFDEMDSLVPRRSSASTDAGVRVVNTLLTELDGAQDRSGIFVIGTTNRPDMIDGAILRPGRLDVQLFVDLPTAEERVDILRTIYKTCHTDPTAVELDRLQGVATDPRCENFSGADLGGLHVKAAQFALQRWLQGRKPAGKEVDEEDWEYALANSRRSVTNYEDYRKLEKKLRSAD